jgi:hypothetical protein
MDTRTLFFDLAEVADSAIASDAVFLAWERHSALTGYTVGGLCAHLFRAVLTVDTYLSQEPPTDEATVVDPAGYFALILEDHDPVASPLHSSIRERAQQLADRGHGALVATARTTLDRLHGRIDGSTSDRVIAVRGGLSMTLDQYLRTRIVELVVHLDDISASVPEADVPDLPTAAYVEAAGVLGSVAALRAGGIETVRSLARAGLDG